MSFIENKTEIQQSNIKKILYSSLLALFAGVLGSFNFAPYNLWYSGLLSLILLITLMSRCEWREGFLYIYLFWLSFFLCSMSWVYQGFLFFIGTSSIKAALLTLFSAFFYSLFLCLPWLISYKSKVGSLWRILSLPFVFLIAEWSRYWILGGLSWSLIGYGHQSTWLAGWIPIFGVLGASFFVALSASLLVGFCFLLRSKQQGDNQYKKSVWLLIPLVIPLAFIWITGFGLTKIEWTKEIASTLDPAKPVTIPTTVIQPNRPVRDTPYSDSEELYKAWAEHMEAINKGYWQSGLLIWPEGGIKSTEESLAKTIETLHAKAKLHGTNLITGGLYFFDSPQSKNKVLNNSRDAYSKEQYNSVYALGEAQGIYHKEKMAPIGEYIPATQLLSSLFGRISESPVAYSGNSQAALEITYLAEKYSLSTSVCYEIAFGNIFRKQAYGANILSNLSNDLWFDGTNQQVQSLQISQIRALENQKPLLRSAVTGISAIIDYKGNILQKTPSGTVGILSARIQPREGATPYSLLGDIPILLIGFMSFLFGIIFNRRIPSI